MKIQFLGATQTVTGSKYLVQTEKMKILVDCGLFQGYKDLRLRNWAHLPISPSAIDYVLLTHAHIDHSGYIPLLVKNGFRGKILCTEATRDLCRILLPDSGHLQEEDAQHANRHGYSKHHPALPLYTQKDAEIALKYFKTIPFKERFQLHEGFHATFQYAGHILGASIIRIEHEDVSLLFSGDLGRPHDPIMNPPNPPCDSDYLVIESTYGNRLHDKTSPAQQLGDIIRKTAARGGITLIPAFAVGRTQTLLYYIHQLKVKKEIPDLPVIVDSPMATNATQVFAHHARDNKLTEQQCAEVCSVAKYIQTVEESKALNQKKMPMIIISASGMATGGRVLHHLCHVGTDRRNTILFSGFQAGGTRGDRILKGEKEIKMYGQMIPIHAEICQMTNLSAHVDYEEMLAWLAHLNKAPQKLWITHGELESAEALKHHIEEKFHWQCEIPQYLKQLDLTK